MSTDYTALKREEQEAWEAYQLAEKQALSVEWMARNAVERVDMMPHDMARNEAEAKCTEAFNRWRAAFEAVCL